MALRVVDLQTMRHFVRIEYDAALTGEQEPDYKVLVDIWPCNITYETGTEGMHGRQPEGVLGITVYGIWDYQEWGRYRSNMRLCVLEGMQPAILNVVNVVPKHMPHRQEILIMECEELDE